MVTYLVLYTVQHEIHDSFVEWLKSDHIPEMLEVPGFMNADLCLRKGGTMIASSKEVRVVYRIKDEAFAKSYISESAMKLRERALEKFPGQFSAQREMWLETVNFMTK